MGVLCRRDAVLLARWKEGMRPWNPALYPAAVKRLIPVDSVQITSISALVGTFLNAPGIVSVLYGLMFRQTYSPASLQRSLCQHDVLTKGFFQTIERAC